jgi:hypothetical protein
MAYIRRTFSTPDRAATADLLEMTRVNLTEGLGTAKTAAAIDWLNAEAYWIDEAAVAVDGRMQPHEWIESHGGLVKVDGLDHHDDHFFPGPTDVAWDVVAAICELGLDAGAASSLVEQYRAQSGDRTIGYRLAFYHVAYLASRLGYASMAAESLAETPDGARFRRSREHYRRSLAALVSRPRSVPRR